MTSINDLFYYVMQRKPDYNNNQDMFVSEAIYYLLEENRGINKLEKEFYFSANHEALTSYDFERQLTKSDINIEENERTLIICNDIAAAVNNAPKDIEKFDVIKCIALFSYFKHKHMRNGKEELCDRVFLRVNDISQNEEIVDYLYNCFINQFDRKNYDENHYQSLNN